MTVRPLQIALLEAALTALAVHGQPVVLELDVENLVAYVDNAYFPTAVRIGDITAVNGHPVKGTYVGVPFKLGLTPVPQPGQAIADTAAVSLREESFQILGLDGVPVGSILTLGTAGGPSPRGAPSVQANGDLAIAGGTGAFLGVRGEKGRGASIAPLRYAAADEDPADRRRIGGGHIREILQVIPMSQPEIVITAGRLAVTHSKDSTPVSVSKPAKAGEVLSLLATGLAPTRPSPRLRTNQEIAVNSPVEVTMNGKAAEVISARTDTVDRYQVNFRVPPGIEKGMATVQVIAAWIASPPATISVQ
jgi:hypothetical protein